MLGNDQRAGCEKAKAKIAEVVQGNCIFFRGIVGRIEEDEVERHGRAATKASGHATAGDLESRIQAQLTEVRAKCLECRGRPFSKKDMLCAATERLDANGAGAGIKVGKNRSTDARSENIKEGFAETVAGGPRGEPCGSLQGAAPQCACNDAHR